MYVWLSQSDVVGILRVEVTDSGAGLTQQEQKSIFGEFTQFNKNKLQAGGDSIPLYVCICM